MALIYLLDTNSVSHLIKRHPRVTERLLAVPMHTVFISAITAGELAFGLAKRPESTALKAAVEEFLSRVEVLHWDKAVALTYGKLRAQQQAIGAPLSPLDTQIAAHAVHLQAILISSDRAFLQVNGLRVEDWAAVV